MSPVNFLTNETCDYWVIGGTVAVPSEMVGVSRCVKERRNFLEFIFFYFRRAAPVSLPLA